MKYFITNYFMENKLAYFKDNSLNYNAIPDDCRTNNYLENYNGFIKSQLGKTRIVNWVNFIHFIKKESERSIEKLFRNTITKSDTIDNSILLEKKFITDKEKTYNYKETNINKTYLDKLIEEGQNIERIINSTIGIYNKSQFVKISIRKILNSKNLNSKKP